MKKITKLFFAMVTAILILNSCSPEEIELGNVDVRSDDLVEGIAFSIEYDAENPNIVYLTSLMDPQYTPLWNHPQGRSQQKTVELKIPFPGTYNVVYGVMTRGGVVYGDTATFEISDMYADFISDAMWVNLAGGGGEEKTWIMDNGNYGLAPGALSYADPSSTVEWENFSPNWEPEGNAPGSSDEDMGWGSTMTFSLKGGAFMTTNKLNEGGKQESGTFMLNVEDHTITTNDATILRPDNFIANVENWTTDLKILTLTENQLQIAVMRTNDEGSWWYIWNYVSKDYADNYIPTDKPDPDFDHGDQMFLLAGNSSTTWRFATQSPFNWTNLDGDLLNEWNSVSDYPDWTGYNTDAITDIENVRITFSRLGVVHVVQNDGTVQEGSFIIDEKKNLISFTGIKPSILISGGWVTATTTDEVKDDEGKVIIGDNQWKIVKTKKIGGITTDVWFGKRDPEKKEYMVYHFELDQTLSFRNEMIKALTGGISGETSRIFKIDTNWPVDWTNLLGQGWTSPGEFADWYWDDAIAASVENQRITFSQNNGVVTVTKLDEEGNTSSSPVEIDGINLTITIPDMDIIKFGAGSWLPTTGPLYYWVRGEFNEVETNGFWIGIKSQPTELTAYRYILVE